MNKRLHGLIALLALALSPCAARAEENCAPDGQIMLLQDYQTFDLSGRGWRAVGRAPGCEAAAADLIAKYRALQRSLLSDTEAKTLRFHEGQVRAGLGQKDAALALFSTVHDTAQEIAWNAYVDATVAFLKKDRPALEAARGQLASAPTPPDFDAMAADYEQQTGRRPTWPPNLDVVDALITCFDRSYSDVFVDPVCRR